MIKAITLDDIMKLPRDKFRTPDGKSIDIIDLQDIKNLFAGEGKWLVYEIDWDDNPIAWSCSNCGEVVDVKYNYCPECGSDMD